MYYGLYSNETSATYSLTNCSSAWLLDMSSVYTVSPALAMPPSDRRCVCVCVCVCVCRAAG